MLKIIGMDIEIRNIHHEDFTAVYQLICELEGKSFDQDPFFNMLNSCMEDIGLHFLLAVRDKEILGLLSLRIEYQLHHAGKIAEIMEFFIQKKFRSRGIGKILFEKAKELSVSEQCIQLEVCSNFSRSMAHQFYRNRGMKCVHYKFTLLLNNH